MPLKVVFYKHTKTSESSWISPVINLLHTSSFYLALTGVSTDFKNYVTNDLLPPAFNYLQAALKVKPVSGTLTGQGVTTMCSGLITPNSTYAIGNGVNADLVIFLTQTNEPSSSFLAYAGACLLDPVTYRYL